MNCAAVTETLLESELFGHEKGAFTGAERRKEGRFFQAHGGSLFLDEIAELPLTAQVKLLRFLEQKEFERIGDSNTLKADVRVVAATNHDLQEKVRNREFREDLFYRLNIIPVHLPPLRARINDIKLLADHFIQKYNRIENRSVKGLTQEALAFLQQMPWKGNIRELENKIERATLICRNDLVVEVVKTIETTAHTGLKGDGKIYVSNIEQAVRISTGERGESAV